MFRKKLHSIFAGCLAAALLVSNAVVPVQASTQPKEEINFSQIKDITKGLAENKIESVELETKTNLGLDSLNFDKSSSLGIVSKKNKKKVVKKAYTSYATAADDTSSDADAETSITQSFTDYITNEDEMKSVTFALTEGSILDASLSCPKNSNLDYNLVLASIDDDGSVTPIKVSSLGTYVDPSTGKTVDEGISYVHNQATIGYFALFVLSSAGSSTTESFTLTVSIGNPGIYDSQEPNDSAFEATSISGLSASGSLHVENDQDWYMVDLNAGLYEVTAGNYKTDMYLVATGNKLVKPDLVGSRYIIDDEGTYFVKVSSDKTGDNFKSGSYTLRLEDKSVYTTLNTAYDFGNWEDSYSKMPAVVPVGQGTAYYKFSIDPEDRVYASIILTSSDDGTLIAFLNDSGEVMDYGFSGSASLPNTPAVGKIKYGSNGLSKLVVNINGTQTNGVAYLQVTKLNPKSLSSGGTPSIDTRIHKGHGTFSFSGTASNSGNSTSSVLYLDLTNNSSIPPYAVVDEINTTSDISYSVGGVRHQINPGGAGWLSSVYTSAEDGMFRIGTQYNIQAKQPWQFRYTQTALKSTKMSRVKMQIDWEYDIRHTNYELFY